MNNTQQSTNPFATYSHAEMKQKVHVSSCKIFDGEDLTAGNRKRLQQMQQKDWIDQQIKEKQERLALQKETDRAYEQQTLHINYMARENEKFENTKRQDIQNATREMHKIQNFNHLDKANYERQLNNELSEKHIDYTLNNDFQTENTQTCQSMLAPHRVLPYHWKGMNDEQKKEILLKQEQQKQENKMLADLEKETEKMYAKQTETIRLQQVNLDKYKTQQNKERWHAIKEHNLKAAQEHSEKIKTMYGKPDI